VGWSHTATVRSRSATKTRLPSVLCVLCG